MIRPKRMLQAVGAVCMAILLSGCIIEPAWGPRYHHWHHWER